MSDGKEQFPDLDVLPNLEETGAEGGDKDMVRKDATAVLDRDSISVALAKLNMKLPDEAPKPEPKKPTPPRPKQGGSLALPIIIGVLVGLIIAVIVIMVM